MDDHNEMGEALNEYGVVATHDDCSESWRGGCQGWMGHWENPNTGNTRLLCAEHSEEAERRQNEIHSAYLNDSIYEPGY